MDPRINRVVEKFLGGHDRYFLRIWWDRIRYLALTGAQDWLELPAEIECHSRRGPELQSSRAKTSKVSKGEDHAWALVFYQEEARIVLPEAQTESVSETVIREQNRDGIGVCAEKNEQGTTDICPMKGVGTRLAPDWPGLVSVNLECSCHCLNG